MEENINFNGFLQYEKIVEESNYITALNVEKYTVKLGED